MKKVAVLFAAMMSSQAFVVHAGSEAGEPAPSSWVAPCLDEDDLRDFADDIVNAAKHGEDAVFGVLLASPVLSNKAKAILQATLNGIGINGHMYNVCQGVK